MFVFTIPAPGRNTGVLSPRVGTTGVGVDVNGLLADAGGVKGFGAGAGVTKDFGAGVGLTICLGAGHAGAAEATGVAAMDFAEV